ncbi:hypothetical protein MBANPS3_012314, partial [Mucor bainieri]
IDNENGKELKPEDYGRIVGACWELGGSYGKIAKANEIGKTTVKQIIDRFQETRSPLPGKRPGASQKFYRARRITWSLTSVEIQLTTSRIIRNQPKLQELTFACKPTRNTSGKWAWTNMGLPKYLIWSLDTR